MSKLLIIDANNHFHRAFHKFQNLTHKGKSVASVYGFPYILGSLLDKIKPDKLICVWDGGKNPKRLELCPEYKAKRKLMPNYESFIRQKNTVFRMLYYLGVTQVWAKDCEADDMIYSLVRKYRKQYDEIIIASNDKDFNQLVNKRVNVWNDNHKLLINTRNMKQLYGYTPELCVSYLALGGDKSDNVKGLRGYGEGSKALTNFFSDITSSRQFINKFMNHDKLSNYAQQLKLNLQVVGLRLFNSLYIKTLKVGYYKNKRKPKFNETKFKAICHKYHIQSFVKPPFIKKFKTLHEKN